MLSPSNSLLAAALLLVAFSSFSQPVNDDCAGAVLLAVSANPSCDNTESGTTVGATYSGTDYCNTPYLDVWYKFVATATAHTISLSNVRDVPNNGAYFFVEVFSGECSNLVHSFCSAPYPENGSISFGDLTPGETYFIRVLNPFGQEFNFDICISTPPTPPANDACVGAISLTVDPDEICDEPLAGSTAGSTISPVPVCYDCPASDDVWYTFTATQPNHAIALANIRQAGNPNAPEYGVLNVFSGTCGSFTLVQTLGFYDSGSSVVSSLVPGETYYLRVFSSNYLAITYDLCVTSSPPPANDECSGAETIAVSSGLYCEYLFTVTTYLATSSGTNCQAGAAKDVWFQFVATSTAHRIELYSAGGLPENGYEVYSGDCGNLVSIACASDNETSINLSGLTAGATYYLRMFSGPANQNYFQQGCILTLPPPPANDACAGAQALTVNTGVNCADQTNGSTLGATSSAQNCTGNAPTHDVWYSFVATTSTHRVEVYTGAIWFGSYTTFGYEVLSGDCNNLTSLACKSFYTNFGPTILSGLTPGDTYFIRAYSDINSAHDFTICVQTLPPPPANSDCAGAEVLTPSPVPGCTVSTAGSTTGVLAESGSTCYYGTGMPVWYSFTATNATHVVRITDVQQLYGSYEYWLETYEGGDCNSLTFKDCYVYPGTVYLNNLVAGQTYHLRWVSAPSSAHTFNICVGTFPPPPNDLCENAIALPVDNDEYCDQEVSGSTAGSAFAPSGNCFNYGDVWYSFTATQGVHKLVVGNAVDVEYGNYQVLSVELLAGDCNNPTSAYCFESSIYGNNTLVFGDLIAGQTYYLRIGAPSGLPVNFSLCLLTPPPPPANDACAGAIELTPEPGPSCTNPIPGTTFGASPSQGVPPLCCGLGDVWYTFTATQANHSLFLSNVVNAYYNYYYESAVVELYSSTCGALVQEGQFNVYYSGSWALSHLTPGQTYLIRLYGGYSGQGINFDICLTAPPPPANDECVNALPLPISEDLTCNAQLVVSTLGATQSLPACYGNPANDLWYQFTATSATYRFDPSVNYGYSYEAWGFEIFSGDCNAPVSIHCEQPYSPLPVLQSGFVPGETYYLRFFSLENNTHDLALCTRPIPPPPANDECANAAPVLPNDGLTCDLTYPGTTLGATFDPSFYTPDVWFSFTATSNSHLFDLLNLNTILGNPNALNFDVYQGNDCNTLNLLANFTAGYTNLLNYLQPGETYFIRVYPGDPNSAYTFDLCIKTLPPSPPNEDCVGAFTLTPNEDLNCNITTSGSTAGAITASYTGCGYGNDVWYQFTATSPNHLIQASSIVPVLGNGSFWVEVLQSPDCASFSSLACTYYDQTIYLSNLVPGEFYYVKTVSEFGSAHNYDLCIQTIPPPPNDLCVNAVSLDVSSEQTCQTTVSGTTNGSGSSPGLSPCGFDGNDVWYSFTATQGSHTVLINNVLDAQGGYAAYFGVEIYGGACGSLQNLACRSNLYYSDQFTVGELTAGAVYYIRVFSYYFNGATFDICVGTPPPPPANDACANATTLPVSSGETCDTQTSGVLEGATPSPIQSYFGYGILYNDVWYSFTATQPNHILTLNDFEAPNIFLVAEVLTGSCGSFNALAQLTAYYGNELTLTNLTPGETYHVRVYDAGNQSANFEICVSSIPVPPNDECAGALPLDVNPDLSCSVVNTISTYGATQSAPSCYGNAANDVWFQFTAAGTSQRLDFNPHGSPYAYFSFGIEVFEGSCEALTPIFPCSEYYYSNTASYTLQNLIAGETYYVRLYVFPGNFQDYDICIRTLPEPPANDECAGAEMIQANVGLTCDLTYNGSTLGATQSATSCYGNSTHDVWYQFTAVSVSQLVDFQFNSSIFSNFDGFLGIEIYAGDGCGNLSSLQCYEYTPNPPITLSGLTVGGTYFIRVFSQYNSAHEFSLCIQTLPPPPANDDCFNAQVVMPNEGLDCTNPVAGTTAGVLTYDYFGCQNGPDVWYQFTATNNIHLVKLEDVVNQYGFSYLSLELYQGTDCFSLSTVACSYGQHQIYAPYLIAGETYYIRVVGAQSSGTDFNLCVLTVLPPANDECASAVSLPVSSTATCETTLHGTTLGATQSNVPNGCNFGSDIWYSFVATSAAHTVNINNVGGGNYYDLIYEVFSGNCDELTSLGCYSAYTLAAFNNLTPGDTYYVRVGTYTQNIFDYDICIGLSLPDLVPVYLAVNADYCGLGNNETVQAVFYNQGTAPVPVGAAVYNLSVSGANNGNYGPLTNSEEIPPGLYGYVEFTGVDLSNPGYNQLIVTGTAPGDPSYEESGLGFTGLPLLTLYYDVDGDGYGNPDNFIVDCYQYEWLVTNGDDCDDYNFYVNPAASEFCNGYDDNCDGLTDAADPNVIDTIPPTVLCPLDTILNNDAGECFALLTHNVVSVWDDCSFTVEQIGGIESGGAFPVGTSVVTYQVTDSGDNQATCSFTVEVQKTGDPDLLYAYTVISFKDLTMKKNTVESGGVGVVNSNKKAKLEQNTEVTAANTFVKAPVLELNNNSQVTTYYQGQVASSLLPAFQPNNNPGNNNVTIAANSAPVVLSLSNYGKITVGNNVTITFSGNNVVGIKELALGNNVTVLFAQNTEILVDKKVDIGKDVTVNPGSGFVVQFFAEGNVTIDKGCDISANLYTEKNLDLKKATTNKPTYMTGLFIADKVTSEEHVHWNWDETYCPSEGQNRTDGRQVVEKQEVSTVLPGKLLLAPNPASDKVQVIFTWETEGEATLFLYDATGRLARTEQLTVVIGENHYHLDLANLSEGMYTLQLIVGEYRTIEKLIIVK